MDTGVPKGRTRMGTRQHGCGKMRCGGHNIGGNENMLHHLAVQRLIVAACLPVAYGQSAVCSREQGTGATGKVGELERDKSVRIGPICFRIEARHR